MDNIYFYIGESLDIMALVILLIICAGHLYGYLNSPLFRIYTGLILASAVYVGAGGLLYHLLRMGVGHSSPLFRFTVCLISTSYYTVTVMYVRYILEYISSYRSPLSKRPFYLSLAIAIPASLFWIIMYLNGLLMNASTLNLEGIRVLSFTSGYAVTAISVYLLLRYRRDLPVKNTLLLLFMMLSPLLTSLLRTLNPHLPYLQMLVMLTALILNNDVNRDLHYRLQEQEKRLQEARVQLMISQIQPHFMFNVLNTIYSLCDVSVSRAQHAIDEFSQYLRVNLEVLDDPGLVPIDRELECLEHYLILEKMRYGEDLKIMYDISPCHFFLPPLTLQPIVENAVRHGIGKKPEGGTVTRPESPQQARQRDQSYNLHPEILNRRGNVCGRVLSGFSISPDTDLRIYRSVYINRVIYIISIVCVVCINKYNTLFPSIMHLTAVRPYTEPQQDSSRIAGL